MSMKENYQNYCERRGLKRIPCQNTGQSRMRVIWSHFACSEMCIMWVTAGYVYT